MFLVPVLADFWRLFFFDFSVTLYLYPPIKKPLMKLKISMSYPPSANNLEHPMPCRPCRTPEASFFRKPCSTFKICHIPLQLNFEHPSSVGPVTRGQSFFFFFLKLFKILNNFLWRSKVNRGQM